VHLEGELLQVEAYLPLLEVLLHLTVVHHQEVHPEGLYQDHLEDPQEVHLLQEEDPDQQEEVQHQDQVEQEEHKEVDQADHRQEEIQLPQAQEELLLVQEVDQVDHHQAEHPEELLNEVECCLRLLEEHIDRILQKISLTYVHTTPASVKVCCETNILSCIFEVSI